MEAIKFTDKNLEKEIKELLKKPEGDIFPADVANIESLDFDWCDISDISPIANCKELKELLLSGNKITDITPLAALTKLTTLELDTNHITDLSPLAGMENLERLSLYGNDNLTDLTPLAGLKKLITEGGLELYDEYAEACFYMRNWPNEDISICIIDSEGEFICYTSISRSKVLVFEEPEHYSFNCAEYDRIRLDDSVVYQAAGDASEWVCLYLSSGLRRVPSSLRQVIVDSSGVFLEYDLYADYESWCIENGGWVDGYGYLKLDSYDGDKGDFVFGCKTEGLKFIPYNQR